MFRSNSLIAKLTGLFALVGLLHAAPAAADTFNVTGLTPTTPYTQTVFHTPSSFIDFFNFSLSNVANVSGAAVSLELTLGSLDLLNIDNLSLALYNSANSLVASGSSSLNVSNITGGNYYVRVAGDANGIAGGQYLFGLAIQAVPEPEQWMLFMAGLLAVGSIARRRMDA